MIASVDGICSRCAEGFATKDGKTCYKKSMGKVECGPRQRRINLTQCATCPDYTKVSADGTKCLTCPIQ